MTDIALVVLVVLSLGMVILAKAVEGTPQVVIDGYTVDSTITSPATLPLGRTALLVCRVSGIPHGQQTSYQWTCPNQPCLQTGYAGRKIDNNIIAINTTSATSDGGTYTCTVTAGGMEGRQEFGINVTGGDVVHSFGRLIPPRGVISTASQLQPPNNANGDGRIECTVNSETADFRYTSNDVLNGTTATYNIPAGDFNNFSNKEGYCGSIYHLLFLSQNTLPVVSVAGVSVGIDNIMVSRLTIHNSIIRVMVGYDRLDLGLPMVGQYQNNQLRSTVNFTSLVPGARYRITVWGTTITMESRSKEPTVVEGNTGPSVPSPPRALTVTINFEDGIELNWIPPRETNGNIQHYIIRYTTQNGTEQEITTTDNTNYYNLTGLERGQIYYNFTVKAVNLADTSSQSNTIGNYTLHIPGTLKTPTIKSDTTIIIIGATVLILLLSITLLVISGVLIVKNRKKRTHLLPYNNNHTLAIDNVADSQRNKIVNGSNPVGDKAVANVEDSYSATETTNYQDLDPNTVDYENIYIAPQNIDQNSEWGEADLYKELDDDKLDDEHLYTVQNGTNQEKQDPECIEDGNQSDMYEELDDKTLDDEHIYTAQNSNCIYS